MLKAVLSYSKKIPVPDSEYSSQGFSLSLETEIPESDPKAIQARIHSTFELVKASVEQELANGKGLKEAGPGTPSVTGTPTRRENDNPSKASNKQVKYICDLSRERGITLAELNAKVLERYGAETIYDLGKADASKLVELLRMAQKKAA
ncbi:MAG: hypothetical protein WCP86_06860 [bacterium]